MREIEPDAAVTQQPVAKGTYALYSREDGGYELVLHDPDLGQTRRHTIPGRLLRMAGMSGQIKAMIGGRGGVE